MTNIAFSPLPASRSAWAIWARWTLITSVGEFLGFAVPALVGAAAATTFGSANTLSANLTFAAVMIGAGAGEGALLGLSQWVALRPYLPRLQAWDWVKATIAGAMVAWAIGMLPSTLGDPTLLPTPVLILGALILGPILLCSIGFAQYQVLRHHRPHARWWIAATALAWLCGLVVVFAGIALIPDNASPLQIALLSSLAGLGMGTVAAGVSGVALVWLLRPDEMKA
jgi:hypothetical protein